VRSFPGLELVAYDTQVPQSWEELVQERINHLPHVFDDSIQINLWDGLSGVRGYRAIRWLDAIFYKTAHIAGASWDTALQYNANRIYSLLSRRFSGWSYASSRLYLSPFAWIDEGQSEFEKARPPVYVAEQLAAFRKWGTGGEFANYAYRGLDGFDYGPYLRAMKAASTPGRVDSKRPGLSITARSRRSGDPHRVDLQGFATDNLAIRAVRWRDDRGRKGTAKLEWIVDSGDAESGWNWRMKWWVKGLRVPARPTRIWIRAEDIKGLATVRSIRIPR
jgi:hypothetical protein